MEQTTWLVSFNQSANTFPIDVSVFHLSQMLYLRYSADIRTLGILSLFFGITAFQWIVTSEYVQPFNKGKTTNQKI